MKKSNSENETKIKGALIAFSITKKSVDENVLIFVGSSAQKIPDTNQFTSVQVVAELTEKFKNDYATNSVFKADQLECHILNITELSL